MGSMSHNTSGNTPTMVRFEEVMDNMIREALTKPEALLLPLPSPLSKKRKKGDEAARTRQDLYRFFYRALQERRLLSVWIQKSALDQCRWRLDELDQILNREEGPSLPKAEKALEDLLKELSTALYSDLF